MDRFIELTEVSNTSGPVGVKSIIPLRRIDTVVDHYRHSSVCPDPCGASAFLELRESGSLVPVKESVSEVMGRLAEVGAAADQTERVDPVLRFGRGSE